MTISHSFDISLDTDDITGVYYMYTWKTSKLDGAEIQVKKGPMQVLDERPPRVLRQLILLGANKLNFERKNVMGHGLANGIIPDIGALYSPSIHVSVATNAVAKIVFPEPGQLRSRKVVSRSNARPTGKYPSWKMGRMLHWESRNELNAFRLLDCDPDVTSFNEQPCEVVYMINGETRSHFPDILVQAHGKKEFWEVKPESKALEPEVAARTALLIRSLPVWGYAYRVVLDTELAAQPRQRNAFFLLGYGRKPATDCERESIRRAMNRCGALLWSDVCNGEYGPRGRNVVCSLVLRGVLTVDMNSPVSANTRFVARKGEL
jgi:hypothetical protein